MGPTGNLRTFANLAGRGRVFVATVAITVKPATPGHTHINGHTHFWHPAVTLSDLLQMSRHDQGEFTVFCILCSNIETKQKQRKNVTVPKVSQMHTTRRTNTHARTE